MPIILIPFIILAARNTAMHHREMEAQERQADIQQKQYDLLLAEHNAHYGHGPVSVRRGILVKH
jgi:hypothetical protein